jgi:hypothetical protein
MQFHQMSITDFRKAIKGRKPGTTSDSGEKGVRWFPLWVFLGDVSWPIAVCLEFDQIKHLRKPGNWPKSTVLSFIDEETLIILDSENMNFRYKLRLTHVAYWRAGITKQGEET